MCFREVEQSKLCAYFLFHAIIDYRDGRKRRKAIFAGIKCQNSLKWDCIF